MNWIDVISAGPGDRRMLTAEALQAIGEADAVFCAERNDGLVPDAGKRRSLTPLSAALDDLEALLQNGCHTAVLVSGDAGLYSLLPVLKKRFGGDRLRVYPGVSSLQAFCARLCENESNVKAIQELMGHADISTTMNIYAEISESKKKQVMRRLEGKIRIS